MKLIVAAIALMALPVTGSAEKSDFVFFLVDDLGWADVGCNGSSFHRTPHIDALAKSGVRFTDGYAAAFGRCRLRFSPNLVQNGAVGCFVFTALAAW